MPRLRQMPELFLRGALANETMKHLSQEQKDEVNKICRVVASHPKLGANRAEFTKQLGRTIGGDYREDRSTADQEYQIAIWRGVVHLLYHCSYSFRCTACDQSTYLTQRNKPSAMDRRYPVCPACRKVRITSVGGTDLVVDSFMGFDVYQEYLLHVPANVEPPTMGTPIVPIPGMDKVTDPHAILADPGQLHKFFSEFIWNYFRQILKENEITYHMKEPQKETGPADRMAVLEIVSLLGRVKTPYQYCVQSQPEEGQHHVYCQTATTPPEFTAEYAELLDKYKTLGIHITHNDREFLIPDVPSSGLIDALVVRPAPVLMSTTQTRIGGSGEESTSYAIERLEYKNSGETSLAVLENEEILTVIRSTLPDGNCVKTYDILTAQGDIWDDFSTKYGDSTPRAGHIANFLGTTSREINNHRRHIMIHMYANGLTPGSLARQDD